METLVRLTTGPVHEPVHEKGRAMNPALLAEPENFTAIVCCMLCGSSHRDVVFTQEPFQVLRCKDCELVYVSPRLKPKMLPEVYNEDYWTSGTPKSRGYADYRKEAKLYLRTFHKRMQLVKRFCKKPGVALDIGSAAGFFLKVLMDNGWEANGVELSPQIASFATDCLGIANVHVGELASAGFADKSFDLISMWDLVEHIPEPLSLLKKAVSLLKDDGHIIIETQNVESRFARFLGPKWQHYKHLEHLYHFSPKTIEKLLGAAGLEILHNSPRYGGKHVSMSFIRERATRISPIMKYLLFPLAPLNAMSFYVNLNDEMVIVARKRKN